MIRGKEAVSFPWPLVQFALNLFEELLRDVREIGTFGNVLTDSLTKAGNLPGAPSQKTLPVWTLQMAKMYNNKARQ